LTNRSKLTELAPCGHQRPLLRIDEYITDNMNLNDINKAFELMHAGVRISFV